MRSKFLNIFSLIFNAIIAVGAVAALTIIFVHYKLEGFKLLDSLLLLITFITCAIGMAFNIRTFSQGKQQAKGWYLDLKLTTVGMLVTNIMIGFGFAFEGNASSIILLPRLILPIILFLNFIFCETESSYSNRALIYAPIPLVIYLSVILTLVGTGVMKNPPSKYLDALNNSWLTSLLVVLIIACLSIVATFIIRQLNKLFHYLIIERHAHAEMLENDWMPKNASSDPEEIEEIMEKAKKEETIDEMNLSVDMSQHDETLETPSAPVEETPTAVEKEPEVEIIETEEIVEDPNETVLVPDEVEFEEKPTDTKSITRVYHVSHHRTEPKWQVKLAGSTRAVKLFKTQKEAIDFAKELVKSQGGSYLIHGVDGKIRKG